MRLNVELLGMRQPTLTGCCADNKKGSNYER